ncbi:uncharacterized protein LOC114403827 isoform X2 [Glycine soja]|uniref:uncharacterized protein LOC114403827 isoform X2 n=1 Tax=Glycine soja TaxID=3848 RepID=UPI0010399E3A|nr:uncharacterized protein LOC114403827 isoform X2 [Glycine soja]
MASTSSSSCSLASQFLPPPRKLSVIPFHSTNCTHLSFPAVVTPRQQPLLLFSSTSTCLAAAAAAASNSNNIWNSNNNNKPASSKEKEVEVEVDEELPWIQEKALDLVEFTGSVTQAIPGPRVGPTSLPWILAIPLTYAGLTFVIAFVKTIRKFSSPKAKRRRQTGFDLEEILRKYIRYTLNEKPFNPDMVADLIHLRKASILNDSQVAEILNDISRRIVRDKGPIVMDKSGYTEKGFKRKIAVQALFGKVFYLSELPEFCSRDTSLVVKEIFGVTDEDADKLRIHTISEAGSLDALEKMVDSSNSEDASEDSFEAS